MSTTWWNNKLRTNKDDQKLGNKGKQTEENTMHLEKDHRVKLSIYTKSDIEKHINKTSPTRFLWIKKSDKTQVLYGEVHLVLL